MSNNCENLLKIIVAYSFRNSFYISIALTFLILCHLNFILRDNIYQDWAWLGSVKSWARSVKEWRLFILGGFPGASYPFARARKLPSPIARGVIFSEALCCLLSNIIFPFPPTTGHLLVGEGECLRSLVSHFTYRRERISTRDFRQKHFHFRLLMDTFEANMQPIITN